MYFEIFDGEFHGMMDWLNMLPMWAWIGIGVIIFIVGALIIYLIVRSSQTSQNNIKGSLAPVSGETTQHPTSERRGSNQSEQVRSFCTNCGFRVPHDSDFCPNCGASVE